MMNREIFEESLIQPLQFWSMKSKNEVRALLGEEVAQWWIMISEILIIVMTYFACVAHGSICR